MHQHGLNSWLDSSEVTTLNMSCDSLFSAPITDHNSVSYMQTLMKWIRVYVIPTTTILMEIWNFRWNGDGAIKEYIIVSRISAVNVGMT